MSNSKRASSKLSAEVHTDADPGPMTRDSKQETGEGTLMDQMELVCLSPNQPEKFPHHQSDKGKGMKRDRALNVDIGGTEGGLPACVSPDAVPFTPQSDDPCSGVLGGAHLPPGGSQSADHFPAKSGKSDFAADIADQVNKSVNACLDRASDVSSGTEKWSSSVVESSSSVSVSEVEEVDDDQLDSMMPVEVKFPCYDVLLLHSENEYEEALDVQKHLETEFQLKNKERIKVLLYDDLFRMFNRQIGCLEPGMKHCTFVFILVTKIFCDCDLSRFLGEECLIKSINDSNKKWSVVPLFTQPKRLAEYSIPPGLNCLKGISYHNKDEFYKANMKKMIQERRYIMIGREQEREKRMKKWKDEKRYEILKKKLEEESQEKMLKASRERDIQEWKEQLEKNEKQQSNMYAVKGAPAADLTTLTQQGYQFQQLTDPSTGQVLFYPASQISPFGFPNAHPGYQQSLPFPMNMSYPFLPQPGYAGMQGYGTVVHSKSVPDCMADMMPQKGQEGSNTTNAPLFRIAQPIESVDSSLESSQAELPAGGGECGQGVLPHCTSIPARTVPEPPSAGHTKVVQESKQGRFDAVAKQGRFDAVAKQGRFDAVAYLQQGATAAQPDPTHLDSEVVEDALVHSEQTSVKAHLHAPCEGVDSDSPTSAASSHLEESGYGSAATCKLSSKVSAASYIQQGLGTSDRSAASKGGGSDEGGEAGLRGRGLGGQREAEPTHQGWDWEAEHRGQPTTVVREIHHHHHHDPEAKKVIIIQNCDTVKLGDSSSIHNVRYNNTDLTPPTDQMAARAQGDNRGGDPDLGTCADVEGPDGEAGDSTFVKVSEGRGQSPGAPVYDRDEETTLKTFSDTMLSHADTPDHHTSQIGTGAEAGQACDSGTGATAGPGTSSVKELGARPKTGLAQRHDNPGQADAGLLEGSRREMYMYDSPEDGDCAGGKTRQHTGSSYTRDGESANCRNKQHDIKRQDSVSAKSDQDRHMSSIASIFSQYVQLPAADSHQTCPLSVTSASPVPSALPVMSTSPVTSVSSVVSNSGVTSGLPVTSATSVVSPSIVPSASPVVSTSSVTSASPVVGTSPVVSPSIVPCAVVSPSIVSTSVTSASPVVGTSSVASASPVRTPSPDSDIRAVEVSRSLSADGSCEYGSSVDPQKGTVKPQGHSIKQKDNVKNCVVS